MKILQENYLEQYSEELEILNFKLDRMHEAAFGPASVVTESIAEPGFSLLEDVEEQLESNEPKILNEEAYDLYTEALGQTLKNIWKAIIRMVKSLFVGSGFRISGKEAHTIVSTLKEASEDGKVDGGTLKNMVQKGFYLIAGLGTSVEGAALKSAYDNGNIADYVARNIGKVNVAKIPEDFNFRIAIGTYESNVKNSMAITSAIFKALSTGGIKAVEKMASGVKDKGKAILNKEGAEDEGTPDYGDEFVEGFEGLEGLDELLEQLEPMVEKMSDEQVERVAHLKHAQKRRNEARSQRSEREAKEIQSREEANKKTTPAKLKKFMDRDSAKLHKGDGGFDWENALNAKWGNLEVQAKKAEDSGNSEAAKGYKEAAGKVKRLKFNFAKRPPVDRADFESRCQEGIGKNPNYLAKIGVGAAVGGMIALGIATIAQKAKANEAYGTANDHISLATIVFVNETKPTAMAKVRLYGTGAVVTNFDIKGKENVDALQHDLQEIATQCGANCDKLSPGVQEALMAFGSNITTFFAGLTTKKSK